MRPLEQEVWLVLAVALLLFGALEGLAICVQAYLTRRTGGRRNIA